MRPDSDTETFVALRFEIENWRWAGVPILVRAGKALPARRPRSSSGSNAFRSSSGAVTGSTRPGHDDIVLRIGRHAGVSIYVRAKTPGKAVSQPVSLDLDFAEELGEPPQPYERLLADALRGDTTLFPRWSVIEETWRIVQPLLDAPPPVERYEPRDVGAGLRRMRSRPRTAAGASRSRHAPDSVGCDRDELGRMGS